MAGYHTQRSREICKDDSPWQIGFMPIDLRIKKVTGPYKCTANCSWNYNTVSEPPKIHFWCFFGQIIHGQDNTYGSSVACQASIPYRKNLIQVAEIVGWIIKDDVPQTGSDHCTNKYPGEYTFHFLDLTSSILPEFNAKHVSGNKSTGK